MARLGSLGDVIEDKFYDDIFNALSAYVEAIQLNWTATRTAYKPR